mgnify:CR=1 FL=1
MNTIDVCYANQNDEDSIYTTCDASQTCADKPDLYNNNDALILSCYIIKLMHSKTAIEI